MKSRLSKFCLVSLLAFGLAVPVTASGAEEKDSEMLSEPNELVTAQEAAIDELSDPPAPVTFVSTDGDGSCDETPTDEGADSAPLPCPSCPPTTQINHNPLFTELCTGSTNCSSCNEAQFRSDCETRPWNLCFNYCRQTTGCVPKDTPTASINCRAAENPEDSELVCDINGACSCKFQN